MKIIVLGATGDMGRRAAVELAKFPDVQLTIAGRNEQKLKAVAASLNRSVQLATVDADNPHSLITAIRGHDVAAGAIGPYYLYEIPIAQAAVEARVPYVSICDDHDAAQEVLKLDEAAKARGVTVLTGMGWTPGLTSLMVKKGVHMLDEAKAAHIAWVGSLSEAEGPAVMLHTLHILTGKVPTFRKGRFTSVPAGSEPTAVTFAKPIGRVKVRHVGHPEPVTIPRFIPSLEEVSLKGGLTETVANHLSLALTRLGLTRTPGARHRLLRLMTPVLPLLQKWVGAKEPLSGAHVKVRGTKNGRPATVQLQAVGRMMHLTAVPQAVAAWMMGRGTLHRPGVIAPEADGGPDPDQFFAELKKRGITIEIRGNGTDQPPPSITP